jgi:hypothetical protein
MPMYSEAAYFDGDHCQHCADRDEHRRLQNIQRRNQAALRGHQRRANRDR